MTPETEPASTNSFFYVVQEMLTRVLDGTANLINAHAENFLFGILTLIVGWLVAVLVRHFAARLLRAIGLDVVLDRIGLVGYLQRHEINGRPSYLIGWVLYLSIIYSALVLSFDRMGMTAVVTFLTTIASYIPRLLVVGVLLVLGMVLGKLARQISIGSARLLGLPAPDYFGAGARLAVMLLTFVVALDYLGWASTSILLGGMATILLAGLVGGLLFALCARQLTESLLARGFLTATYKVGDRIRLDDIEGEILNIDSTLTRLQTEAGVLIIPNRRLHECSVTILRDA